MTEVIAFRRAALILMLVLAGLASAGWSSASQAPAAAKEIDALISHVSSLKDVSVRGGPLTVAGPVAARFLRHELDEKSGLVDTAEDFIRLCATKSPQTGRDYEVAYPDGAVLPAATVLRETLRELRAKASPVRPSALSGG